MFEVIFIFAFKPSFLVHCIPTINFFVSLSHSFYPSLNRFIPFKLFSLYLEEILYLL